MNRRPVKPCAIAAATMLLLAACDSGPRTYEFTGASMGTTYSVKTVDFSGGGEALRSRVQGTLDAIEDRLSTYRPDSELSRFNAYAATDWFSVSTELCDAVADSIAISTLSSGAFDVTVGRLVNLWGFGPDGTVDAPPDPQRIASALEDSGYERLHADCGAPALRKDVAGLYVDLSAYAKGLAVDRVADLLDASAVDNYLVEVGGEMRIRGRNAKREKWAIAIEAPAEDQRSVQSIVEITDSAMATSGDYRNYFERDGVRYSHTIDPRTGYPVSHDAASVTVVADTAAFADGIATALLVLGPAAGMDLAERERIAAYFLLRIGDGIEERVSSLFRTSVLGE